MPLLPVIRTLTSLVDPTASSGLADPTSPTSDADDTLPPDTPRFIQARNFTPANRPVSAEGVDWIVIHDMEAPQGPKTAENVSQYFANQPAQGSVTISGAKFTGGSSAHFCVDASEVVQCVLEKDVAWASPGANAKGIAIEHAGYARFTPADWASDYSEQELQRSAVLAASICHRYSIPIRKLSVAELASGQRGICGHVDVTNAFNGGKGHQDPGSSYPWDHYIALIKSVGNPDA